ncbi:MAG: diphthine--ammonia ligase [Bacilli bacterium]
MKRRYAVSFSGGKDSTMMLHKLLNDETVEVVLLYTTITSEYDRISIHGTRREVAVAQAEAFGLPFEFVEIPPGCTYEQYEERTVEGLQRLKAIHRLDAISFGDLHLADVREYRINLMNRVGLEPVFPLWHTPIDQYMTEFFSKAIDARIVAVDTAKLPEEVLGTVLSEAIYTYGIDPAGENGEYHTLVVDGPNMKKVEVETGELHRSGQFSFIDVVLV